MALISASLVSPEGSILAPTLGILQPTIFPSVPGFEDITEVQMIDEFPFLGDNHTIALHIWERGNVGMDELRKKLMACVQFGLVDFLLEIHFLQLPIANLAEKEIESMISPGLLRKASVASCTKSSEHNHSFVDIMFNSSRESTEQSQRDMEEAVKGPVVLMQDAASPDWEQREKQRRQQLCREMLKMEAYMGQRGSMKQEYLLSLASFLNQAHILQLPELFYQTWQVPTDYVINSTLRQVHSILTSSLASLASTEITFSIFRSDSDLFDYSRMPSCTDLGKTDFPSSSHQQKPPGGFYVIVGRDLPQWRETMNPFDCTLRLDHHWPKEQQYVPLSSWKQLEERSGLLMSAARKRETFIPRQRMVFAYLVDGKVNYQ